jgi:polyisoprenoid-binding protein YceI
MPIAAGLHRYGPDNAELTVRTSRTGAAARAGHDLVLAVTAWEATLEVHRDPGVATLRLDADATSLRVRSGTGGVQALGDDEKASIAASIDDDVLRRRDIAFRSTSAVLTGGGDRVSVEGELELVGLTRPLGFELAIDEAGRLTGTAVVRQSDWSIKPYSILFGALKVADEVEVVIDAGASGE